MALSVKARRKNTTILIKAKEIYMQEVTIKETQAVVGGYTIPGIPGLNIQKGTVITLAPGVTVSINGVLVNQTRSC